MVRRNGRMYPVARRSVRANVHLRVTPNKRRIEEARKRDEREREAIKVLNQQPKKEQTKP